MREICLWTTLWSLDTAVRKSQLRKNDVGNLSPLERYELLQRMVLQAWSYCAADVKERAQELRDSRPILGFLFVAPEYYFARSHNLHAISEEEKREVVGRLAELSGRHRDMILVPGTIAWAKKAVRTQDDRQFVRDRRTGKRTNVLKQPREERFVSRLEQNMLGTISVLPSFLDRDLGPVSPGDWKSALESNVARIQDETSQSRELMRAKFATNADRVSFAKNTAYAFHSGCEVARYQKMSNHFEVFDAESDEQYLMFEPGGADTTRQQFRAITLTFGMEICLDHQHGFLAHSSLPPPHVQILVSAETDVVQSNVRVRPGGYLVHASSNLGASGFYDETGTKLAARTTEGEKGTLLSKLLRFQADLEPLRSETTFQAEVRAFLA